MHLEAIHKHLPLPLRRTQYKAKLKYGELESHMLMIYGCPKMEKSIPIFLTQIPSWKKKSDLTDLTIVTLAAFSGGSVSLKVSLQLIVLLTQYLLNWIVFICHPFVQYHLLCSVFIQEKWSYPFYILGFHKVMEGIHKATELGYRPVKVKAVFIYAGTVVLP